MVSNLATAWQRDLDKAAMEARRESRIEIIKRMAELGADLDFIAKATKSTPEEIQKILD